MRPKYWFYSWRGGRRQAKVLSESLYGRLLLREGSKYCYDQHDIVVNWGSSIRPAVLQGVPVLNQFERVGHGKLTDWERLKLEGIKIPIYTTSLLEAINWPCRVVARTCDHGMGGAGIDIYDSGGELSRVAKPYKFFVKYVKKERELRYHVFNDKVIFIQEKKKKNDYDNANKYIRSHGRGWCFAFLHFNEQPPPVGGEEVACKAVAALGLDFGAVDVAWSERSGFTVFEVNTAPGIENSTLKTYVEAFKNGF